MKRFTLTVLLALAFPLAAVADQTWDFTNLNGALAGNPLNMNLVGSKIINVEGPGIFCPCSASFTLTTFAGATGNPTNSLSLPGTFSEKGSNFIITTVLGGGFDGKFSGPATWTPETGDFFLLSGPVQGTLTFELGTKTVKEQVTGYTSQLYLGMVMGPVGDQTFKGLTPPTGSGDTIFYTTTPEPGTLGLLGTGLIGLAGLVHKKRLTR